MYFTHVNFQVLLPLLEASSVYLAALFSGASLAPVPSSPADMAELYCVCQQLALLLQVLVFL